MSTLEYILLFTFLGSIGSLIGGFILLSKEKFARKISHFLASFAAGTFLGTAFFDLLPEAFHVMEELGREEFELTIFSWTLFGIVLFFLIERFIHWFHHHEEHHVHHEASKSTVPLIIISDTIHNFLDGIVIAATFLVSIPLGIITTFAVAMHEIPQEIGDFGILLHKGLSRKKVILVNVLSAASAFVGALLSYWIGSGLEAYIPIFLSIAAGFFIYIASSDLIPEIHYEKRKGFAFIETMLLLSGIALIYFSVTFLHGH
jgi:zinc and cadmium transporter